MIELLEIEEKILEILYNNFVKWNREIKIKELFKNLSLGNEYGKKLLQIIDKLLKDNILELRSRDFYHDPEFKDTLSWGIEELLYYEKKKPPFQREYTDLITGVLYLFNEIDNGRYILYENEIPFAQLSNILKKDMDINIDHNRFYFISSDLSNKFCTNRYMGFMAKTEQLRFRNLNGPILNSQGIKFLDYQLKVKNFFQNVLDPFGREILREEFEDIHELWGKKKWKDIAIKMGSILEYLITDFFERSEGKHSEWISKDKTKPINLLSKNTKFSIKLSYVMQKEVFGTENNSDWKYVYNHIREYRNYVHLTKLVKEKITFNEKMIRQMYEVFERLIVLF
ncbi:unnamed protein product [marine sediment metagenome]|uniref:Uncharacterized protein n=1 Tax=marine sediment metagenome TaxID=412755 RepID=X0ZDM4_9ZZZZ